MNLDKDKVLEIKMLCKRNSKVIIIIEFLLHQRIVFKCS